MTVYRLIFAERKYTTDYSGPLGLGCDHEITGLDKDGRPLVAGFAPPRLGPIENGRQVIEYVADRPDEPDAFNTSAWEACS